MKDKGKDVELISGKHVIIIKLDTSLFLLASTIVLAV